MNEYYSLTIVHSRSIITLERSDIMDLNKENSKRTFDKQAISYDTDIAGEHARKLYAPILNLLKQEEFVGSVLDLGCGTGALLESIYNLNITEKLSGIDLSPNMIEEAKNKIGANARLYIGDAENLPFEDDVFNTVICNDSFHHYPSPDKVIKEVSRVLKEDGIFIIGDCWQPAGARQIMNFYMKHSKSGDVKIYSKKEMEDLLSNDFHTVLWRRINNTSSLIIARK